jgi:hypothetical protein
MRAFSKLALAEPLVVELREWSRTTDDLNAERNRLGNQLREQLWRYFPAMLEFDLAPNGSLIYGSSCRHGTRRIRETSIAGS